jgi:hypothetical protein
VRVTLIVYCGVPVGVVVIEGVIDGVLVIVTVGVGVASRHRIRESSIFWLRDSLV